MAVFFFTYGDDKFANTKKRIENEAINSKFFNEIKIYGREDIDNFFLEKTKPYIDIRGGFWLWKALFLKQTIDKMNENDYCIYLDAGCTINPNGSDRLKEYLEIIDRHESGVLSFRMDGLDEEQYTTEKVFNHFNIDIDSPIRKSGQIMATMIIFRKCDKSIKIINELYNLALNNTVLFSDEFNAVGNCERFIDNRCDQSIFSVLRKKYETAEIVDETWAPDNNGWNNLYYVKKIPFLATRIRS